ncbi:patatin-like phospholipase family protein [Rhodopila sp.]|uniref:patatin-like phospholipase family protein n=1 Tax=Rhodopila sp. TaxID=2480087 RepID=UPI002B791282|nr:patatin-like phospholipase family protein [Rhodopila sp.]HVZ07613.1 patatin-like phospholipase family protein [Rhodopila sp.]
MATRHPAEPAQFLPEDEALAREAEVLGVPHGSGAALCLSGGGIRSSAFCLGFLQALAQARVLHRFDYLSTVSGGGYISAWLHQMLSGSPAADGKARALDVEQRLRARQIPELDRLRDFTNYLAPRTGPASADSWAAVALYGRNFLVNWAVFLPLFLVIALLPILHRTLVWAAGARDWLALLIGLAGFAAMGVCVVTAARWVPSQRQDHVRTWVAEKAAQQRARWRATACALAFAVSLPVALQYLLGAGWWDWVEPPAGVTGLRRLVRMLVGNVLLPFGFFATLVISFQVARAGTPPLRRGEGLDSSRPRALFDTNRKSWLWAAAVSSTGFGFLLQVLFSVRNMLLHPVVNQAHEVVWVDARADVLTLIAPVVLTGLLLAHGSLYIGWRREARFGDLDREWLARLNGTTLAFNLAWTLFAAACIVPSRWFTLSNGEAHGLNITLAGLSAIASGFLSSWLGKQAAARITADVNSGNWRRWLPAAQVVLPLVFIVTLFAFLSALLQDTLGAIAGWLPSDWLLAGEACDRGRVETPPCPVSGRWVPVLLQIGLGLLLIAALLRLRSVVNVNRFSMHAVYRNRLVRAFLGTARDPASRHPDPFTGFDDDDNPRLAALAHAGPLFPVMNMTLNITTGERGAWAERQGASFVATPHRCGSGALDHGRGAFVETRLFGGMETEYDQDGRDKGMHLGSVMTISGAAASPTWGYHSNPLVALLMTLFNVRLGAWYANPARSSAAALQLSKPADSVAALLNELRGAARGDDAAIYLSDGGHFDNLGVYEMLKRRCRWIVVVDASQDPDCAFVDLGMMIRKAEIDLPVRIDLPTAGIGSRAAVAAGKVAQPRGFASGSVQYLAADGSLLGQGEIIYVKPTLLAAVPTAVAAYASGSASFPHESTMDQFFSESQFESYRALGEFQGHLLAGTLPLPGDDPLIGLFGRVRGA